MICRGVCRIYRIFRVSFLKVCAKIFIDLLCEAMVRLFGFTVTFFLHRLHVVNLVYFDVVVLRDPVIRPAPGLQTVRRLSRGEGGVAGNMTGGLSAYKQKVIPYQKYAALFSFFSANL